jgi:hypothetical protein
VVEKEIYTKQEKRIKKVICDVCKKEFTPGKDDFEIQEFVFIRIDCGYESIFGDGNSAELDICQHCLKSTLGEYIKIIE